MILNFLAWLFFSSAYYNAAQILDFGTTVVQQLPIESEIVLVSSGQEYAFSEVLKNGDFSAGLDDWNVSGDAELVENCFEMEKCLRLGSVDGENQTSSVKTELDIGENSPKNLKFELKTETTEYLPGFDEPVFAVAIDDRVVYRESFQKAIENTGQWRQVYIPLQDMGSGLHELSFHVLNTGDNLFKSQVEIRSVTTLQPQLGFDDFIEIKAEDSAHTVFAERTINGQTNLQSSRGEITISSQDLSPEATIKYWSENDEGSRGEISTAYVAIDLNSPPPPEIESVSEDTGGKQILTITKPLSGIYLYQAQNRNDGSPLAIKYLTPVLSDDDHFSQFSAASLIEGKQTAIIEIISPAQDVELRSVDQAGNYSSWVSIPPE